MTTSNFIPYSLLHALEVQGPKTDNLFGSHTVQLKKIKYYNLIKKLPVLVGPLSAIQPFNHPLTFNFSWSLGYIRKLAFGSPWGNYFTPGFVFSQHTMPRNI